jgi:rubredoxin
LIDISKESGILHGNHYAGGFSRIQCVNYILIINVTGEKQRMDSYQCMICGHVYDPGRGEPSVNIPAGTDFSDLPGGWRCPVCQASPEKFRKA